MSVLSLPAQPVDATQALNLSAGFQIARPHVVVRLADEPLNSVQMDLRMDRQVGALRKVLSNLSRPLVFSFEPGRLGELGDRPAAGRDALPEVGAPVRRVAIVAAIARERRSRTSVRCAHLSLPMDAAYSPAAEMAPKASPNWTCRGAAYPSRSWMIGFSPSSVTSRLASVIGSLKRRRPALPGLT
jgi:hypothetical protein